MSLIQRLSEAVPSSGISVTQLYYGPAGSGKSRYTCTCGDRTLYIECEGRDATQKSYASRYGFNPIWHTVTEEAMPDGGAKALDKISDILKESEGYKTDFDTIVLDGATAFRRFAMNKALELLGATGKSKTLEKSKALDAKFGDAFGFTDVGVQDFGGEMQMIEKFIYKINEHCRKEGKHFLMTAHERLQFGKALDKGGNPIIGVQGPLEKTRPGFTGQTFPDSIPGMFDLTWYAEVIGSDNNKIYRARTEGDKSLIAKTCYGENGSVFPTLVPNPNFLQVVKTIKEHVNGQSQKK